MIVHYEGKEYSFDLDDLTVAQAKVIKDHCNMTLFALEQGLTSADPDALRALYWLMMAQSGESCNIDLVDFKIMPFVKALGEAFDSETARKTANGETPKAEDTPA